MSKKEDAMEVIKQWQDLQDEDGFTNIFEFDDGSLVFTSEKRAVWREASGDLLDEAYKGEFEENPQVNRAMDEVGVDIEVHDFDEELWALWQRCMDVDDCSVAGQ